MSSSLRIGAIAGKEFRQLSRDRVTFGMVVMIPLIPVTAVRLCHQHHGARHPGGNR